MSQQPARRPMLSEVCQGLALGLSSAGAIFWLLAHWYLLGFAAFAASLGFWFLRPGPKPFAAAFFALAVALVALALLRTWLVA